MAYLLQEYWEYQKSVAHICRNLIKDPPKPTAVALPYIPSMNIEQANLSNERVCILAADIGLPPFWAEVVTKLQAMSKPAVITEAAWQNIKDAFGQLAKDNFGLLKLIINHEWTIADIFGCNLTAPMSQCDAMGLVLMLSQGYIVVGVNKQRIKIMNDSNSIIKEKQNRSVKGNLLTDLIKTDKL